MKKSILLTAPAIVSCMLDALFSLLSLLLSAFKDVKDS
jgi:hypothetical protein